MIYAIITLSIILFILITLIIKRELQFKREYDISSKISMSSISMLAISLRETKIDGASVKSRRIKNNLKNSYNIILEKIKSESSLFEYEKWLYENFYKVISKLDSDTYTKLALLPHVAGKPRVLYIAEYIANTFDYKIDTANIIDTINQFQDYTPLDNDELFSLQSCIYYVAIKKLAEIAKNSKEFEKQKRKAYKKNICYKYINNDCYLYWRSKNGKIKSDKNLEINYNGNLSNIEFGFNKTLSTYNNITKNVINTIYDLDANLNLGTILDLSISNKVMSIDSAYKNMDNHSKLMYLNQVEHISKKYSIEEQVVAKRCLKLAKLKNEHFGIYLFDRKSALKQYILYEETPKYDLNSKLKFNQYIFISLVYLITFAIGILSILFINFSLWSMILSIFLCFFSFIGVVENILVSVFRNFISNKPTPMLNYDRVDKDNKTLCIMPCYITNKKDIDMIANNIIEIREGNSGDNINFAVLVDYKSSDTEYNQQDNELNKYFEYKLSNYSDINVYIRKRVKVKNKYISFDRKRGAIMDLCYMLMTKNQDKFMYIMRNDALYTPKFIVTLDSDNKIMPNTILRAINTMLHPLNSEYDLMTLKPKYNLFSINSIYSKRYYNECGVERYHSTDSFYYNLSRHAIFNGKGIFKLTSFYNKLFNVLPSSKILSHDIIEGSILKTGELSDYVYEDAPTTIISEVNRRNRWLKGDLLLLPFIKDKTKNDNNVKVNIQKQPVYKFVMIENILKAFSPIALFGLLLLPMITMSFMHFIPFMLAFFTPYLIRIFDNMLDNLRGVQSKYIVINIFKTLFDLVVNFFTIPFLAVNNLIVILKTLYAVAIDKTKKLEWKTFSESQGRVSAISYIKMITPSIIVSLILSILFINSLNIVSYFAIYTLIMICLYLTSFSINNKRILSNNEKKLLLDLAKKTYDYYQFCTSNSMIADNYQEKPYKGLSMHTSPTNLGFALLADICAFHNGFITLSKVNMRITSKLETLSKLEKHNGNLYNWYDIKTKTALTPKFVSSVDLGNYLACLFTLKSFMETYKLDNINILNNLINEVNLDFLYDKEKQLFTIGYNAENNEFVGHYDLLASEARILYYIYAGTSHDISGYINLKRQMTNIVETTLMSWSGTAFEYLLPRVFMKSPKGSLLDKSEKNAFTFMTKSKCNDLFGISESGYYKFDENLNYQYYAFGLNELAIKNNKNLCVIAPYASILGLDINAKQVINNIKLLKKEKVEGEYGMYEAVDFTMNKHIIYSYMAHHQGMILSSITNYLNNDIISNYFISNNKMKSAKLLLTERNILTKSDNKQKQDFVYNNKKYEPFTTNINGVGVLTNGSYYCYVNNNFQNISICNNKIMAKYRHFDKTLGLTHYTINNKINELENLFSKDTLTTFSINNIECKSIDSKYSVNIVVPQYFNGEVRKISIQNDTNSPIDLKQGGYMDIGLSNYLDDVSHPAFNDMFVSSELFDNNTIIYHRKSRSGENNDYLGVKVLGLSDLVLESNKRNCIDKNSKNIIFNEKNFTNSFGDIITPCFCYNGNITIEKNSKNYYYVCLSYADSLDKIINSFSPFYNIEQLDGLYQENNFNSESYLSNNINSQEEFDFICSLNKNLLYSSYPEINLQNIIKEDKFYNKYHLGKDSKLLVYDFDLSPTIAYSVIFAYRLSSKLPIKSNLILLNSDISKRVISENLSRLISELDIKVINDINDIKTAKSLSFLYITNLNLTYTSLFTQKDYISINESEVIDIPNINFPVKYGGFTKDSYIVTEYAQKPYSNVIAQKNGGVITTLNGTSYSYFGNSRNNKVSCMHNDIYLDIASEKIYMTSDNYITQINKLYHNGYVSHSLGKTIYALKSQGIKVYTRVAMIHDGNAKVYCLDIENTTVKDKILHFDFNIEVTLSDIYNPTFILHKTTNEYVEFYNVINNQRVFIKVIDSIVNVTQEENHSYDISFECKVQQKEKRKIIILMSKELDKLKDINDSNIELLMDSSCNYFESLNKINVKTNNNAFNILFNKSLMYQTVSARLNGKCGFYQVGGAIGFRDQLQDCLAYLYSNPQYVKNHIINCASKQFIEGDVLHWWHEGNLGVRTKISDDKLFLPYLICEYIEKTGDTSILNEKVPYLKSEPIPPHLHDLYKQFEISDYNESLYMHAKRAILNALVYGENENLLIGTGDWNDALNNIGDETKGESVWLSMFCYYVMDLFYKYCDNDFKNIIDINKERLKIGVNKSYFNGYFARAYTKQGDILGSEYSDVCKIDLLCQSFATISNIVDIKKQLSALEHANELVDRDKGIVKLLSPPFDKNSHYGYISSYPKGVRENGGQYTHSVCWYIKALAKHNKDKAYEILKLINPINKCIVNKEYDTEPYVLSGDVYTNGNGGWSYYTGSSSWLYKVIIEDILGIDLKKNTLTIKPYYYEELKDIDINIKNENHIFNIKLIKSNKNIMTVNNQIYYIDKFKLELNENIEKYDIMIEYK